MERSPRQSSQSPLRTGGGSQYGVGSSSLSGSTQTIMLGNARTASPNTSTSNGARDRHGSKSPSSAFGFGPSPIAQRQTHQQITRENEHLVLTLHAALKRNEQLEEEVSQRQETIDSLTETVHIGIKKLLLYKNKSETMEREARRYKKKYEAWHAKAVALQADAASEDEAADFASKKELSSWLAHSRDPGAAVIELSSKIQALLAETDKLREEKKDVERANRRLQRRVEEVEEVASQMGERMRVEKASRETLEKVRRRTRELEDNLRSVAADKVKQQQNNRKARELKVWERLHKQWVPGHAQGPAPPGAAGGGALARADDDKFD
eukprot:Opistho-2@67916